MWASALDTVISCEDYEQAQLSNKEIKDLIDHSFDTYSGDQIDTMRTYLFLAKCYAEKNNYADGIALAEKNLGFYYYLKGDFDQAIVHLNQAEKLIEFSSSKEIAAGVFAFYTLVYIELAHYEIALSYNFKFREVAINTSNLAWQKEVNVNFVDIYLSTGDLEKAQYYFNITNYDSFSTEKAEEKVTYARAWTNLKGGMLYRELGALDLATEYLGKALDIFTALDFGRGIALTRFEFFMVARAKGKNEQALKDINESIAAYKRINFSQQNFFYAIAGKGEILLELDPAEGKKVLISIIPEIEAHKFYRLGIQICDVMLTFLETNPDPTLENQLMRKKLSYLKSTTDQKQKLFEIFRDNELELHKLRLEHANSDFALAKQQILFYFACLIILFLVILAIYWYRNNTKQKGQNKQLTFLNDELSEKMRLVNNQKQQLEDVNNKLEDANQNLENFAAITAHDLRSPLANIYRLNEYVFSKYAHLMSSKDNETCGFVQDNTKRLMKLIEDILSFTNIKEQQVQFSELNIGDAIILAKHNLTLEINEKKVLIEYPKVMPNVMADFNLMVVLFQNLLHNAIKFVKPDQVPHISITSKINKRFVHIRVMDNGIGIPREKMKTVFTLFEKANANRFPGSGVGLSSCKKIVQYFNGRIWIESVEGHGTIVNLEFPIMQSTPKHVEPVEESSLS